MGNNFNVGGNGISNLFQSFSSSSGGGLNYLSDYASIKSGSYARLMKAYYRSDNSSGTTGSSKSSSTSNVLDRILEERKNPKVSEQVKEANANLTSGLSNLTKSVSALQNDSTYRNTEDGKNPADKVVSAMNDYVKEYNNVVTASKRSTLSNKAAYVANMMGTTAANADKLAEIGVTINRDGTLRLNEGKLKSADITKVQDMFSSKDMMSYGSMISSRVQFANAASGTSATDSKDKDNTTGTSAAALKADSETLASDKLYEKVKDKDGNQTGKYDVSKIFDAAKSFVSNYNAMFDTASSSTNSGVLSNLSHIREKTASNADALKQFGISVDSKGRMKIDETAFKKSDMSKVQKFFKDYGSSIATNASLVDYYMNTKANAASGYTSAGSYNVQGSSQYTGSI